jgi:hypothetical protein
VYCSISHVITETEYQLITYLFPDPVKVPFQLSANSKTRTWSDSDSDASSACARPINDSRDCESVEKSGERSRFFESKTCKDVRGTYANLTISGNKALEYTSV